VVCYGRYESPVMGLEKMFIFSNILCSFFGKAAPEEMEDEDPGIVPVLTNSPKQLVFGAEFLACRF